MNVGGVVRIPSAVWVTEEMYYCPQCWKLRRNIIGSVVDQGGTMLPPVLKVTPECHRRCVWSGHATSCLQCRCRRSRQNVIGSEDSR